MAQRRGLRDLLTDMAVGCISGAAAGGGADDYGAKAALAGFNTTRALGEERRKASNRIRIPKRQFGLEEDGEMEFETGKEAADALISLRNKNKRTPLGIQDGKVVFTDHEGNISFGDLPGSGRVTKPGTEGVDSTKGTIQDKTLQVPGFRLRGDVVPKPEEAKVARDALGMFDALEDNLTKLKDYVEKNGSFEFFGEEGAIMQELAEDSRIKLKELAKLGALTGPDLAILSAQIVNPGTFRALERKGTSKARLGGVIDTQRQSLLKRLSAFGYDPEVPLSQEQNGGGNKNEVERTMPDGKIAIFDGNTKQFIRYK